jgi:hypothetical protein
MHTSVLKGIEVKSQGASKNLNLELESPTSSTKPCNPSSTSGDLKWDRNTVIPIQAGIHDVLTVALSFYVDRFMASGWLAQADEGAFEL